MISMNAQAVHIEDSGREKKVPVVIDTHQHPASPSQGRGGHARASTVPMIKKIREYQRKRRKPLRIAMPHNIDSAPPSISEIWGETLTWGVAALALFAVVSLASIFFIAMQIFSSGNSRDILQQAQERLEEAP